MNPTATYIDVESWSRKDHFHFFKGFEEPFFGFCVELDCTASYLEAKSNGIPFSLLYMHRIIKAINEVPALRRRIVENDKAVEYSHVDLSATIDRPDGTFGFSYLPYHPEFEEFAIAAKQEIERVRSTTKLMPEQNSDHAVHFSAVPWLRFTSASHARAFAFADSIPKISVGKLMEENGQYTFPFSIHAHHSVADGRDIGILVEKLGKAL